MIERFAPPRPARDARHSVVYRNDAEFCGWPFLGGLWRAANGDLVAGFRRIRADYSSPDAIHHDRIAAGRGHLTTIRSADNGASWDPATRLDILDLETTAAAVEAAGPQSYHGQPRLDFLDPDVMVANGAVPSHFAPDSRPYVLASADGGRSWRRPILLPLAGLPSITGHGSSMVRSDGVSLLLLTSVAADGWTRRPLVYRSLEDGSGWAFLSFITPQDDDGAAVSAQQGSPRFGAHRYFYPRGIQLSDNRLLVALRCQRDPTSLLWTEVFESPDGGRTWRFLSRVNDWGAPGDIVELADGRIVCVYGYRMPPFGIRARVSGDGGRSWGSEIVLRDDGGSWDLGYPRIVEHEPGRVLAIYYINTAGDPVQAHGGVRHIAQTVFTPD